MQGSARMCYEPRARAHEVNLRLLLVVWMACALYACGECTNASCFDRLEGTLAPGDTWPEAFCEEAQGTLYLDGRERSLEAGRLANSDMFDTGVQCSEGEFVVWSSPEIRSARLELSNGTIRMTLSTTGAELVSRNRPNGPDCDPVCATRVATIELSSEE